MNNKYKNKIALIKNKNYKKKLIILQILNNNHKKNFQKNFKLTKKSKIKMKTNNKMKKIMNKLKNQKIQIINNENNFFQRIK